ncbi:hypothetical protein Lepto7375DRAFT_0472 [Leptolyngbya sp. PCC 7375]|nr:hypothetical protein Lepto7375DRAFT_0472 [Leptolyngbya sp. PCC 7375]
MKISTRIALVALLWLITINSGELGSLDVNLRLQMAHAWWTGTEEVQLTPDMTPKVRGDIRFGVIGADGDRYIAYETGQSFLMLPADWVGSQLHQIWSEVPAETLRRWSVNLLTFIPINVAVVLAAFWLLKLFHFEERVAGLASLTLLLGTTALHYAQVHQHNNQLLLLTTLGYATAMAYIQTRRALWPFLGGIALGMAVFIRVTSMIHALTVILFLVGIVAYKSRQVGAVIQTIGLWLMGFVPVFLISRYIDSLRYGSFLASGKSVEKLQLATDSMWTGLPQLPADYPLINAPQVGILGPLISPAKSIFLYDPLLLPCLILAGVCWFKLSPLIRWYLVTSTLNLGLHLAAYSRFVFWHGDSAWGARYHVTSVHLLLIPLLAVFIQQLLAARKFRRFVLKGILLFALMAQLASVAMPMNLEIFQKKVGVPGTRLDVRLAARATNVACYVDRDLATLCIDRNPDKKQYLEHLNHLSFFPFTFSHNNAESEQTNPIKGLLFLIWSLALVATILISLNTWCLSGL